MTKSFEAILAPLDSHDLDTVLSFDPLQAGGELLGDGRTERVTQVGLALSAAHSEHQRRELECRDDTQFQNTLRNYLRIADEVGYEVVGEYDFLGHQYYGEPRAEERLHLLAHRQCGLLMVLDTYAGVSVNSSKVYYQFEAPLEVAMDAARRLQASGGFRRYPTDLLHEGYFDGRMALRHKTRILSNMVQCLTPWRAGDHPAFLWLWGYGEYDSNWSFDESNTRMRATAAARIAAMPDWARDAFSPVL